MFSSQVETRLRLAAPDEPAVLPALVLPRPEARPGRAWRLMLGSQAGRARRSDVRLALTVALVALAVLATVLGGALEEQLQRERFHFEANGFSLEWPADWTQPVHGDLWLPDGTEPQLLAAQVLAIVSSRELTGCENVTPGPTVPGPVRTGQAVPSGPFAPQPDAMMMCARTVKLPPDAVRLTVLTGQVPGLFGMPNALNEVDWTETIDGHAAQLVVDGPDEVRAPGVDEIRTWLLAVPTAVGSVVRLRAELSGPDVDGRRVDAGEVVNSFRFSTPASSLDLLKRDLAVETGLTAIHERWLNENGSDFFACFPTKTGSRQMVLENGPVGPLAEPMNVSCSTFVTETPSHLWKVTLEVDTPNAAGDFAPYWAYALYLDAGGQIVAEGQAAGPESSVLGEPMP